MRHSHRTKRSDDRDFRQAVEEALLFSGPVKGQPGSAMIPAEADAAGGGPKLSLVRVDDEAVETDRGLPDSATRGSGEGRPSTGPRPEWPWIRKAAARSGAASGSAEGDRTPGETGGAADPATRTGSASQSASPEAACVVDDESATEDLVLCQPPGAHKAMLDREHPKGTRSVPGRAKGAGGPMPDLPPRGDIARLGTQRRGATPRRIGRGTLVPSRLTWKPGDPFGEGKERPASRFRWEVMLTSACITAACGLLCVWLLHSIFA